LSQPGLLTPDRRYYWHVRATDTQGLWGPWSQIKIDEATGVLSGTPDAAGRVDVAVTARMERSVGTLDEKTLAWGNEKVLSTSTEQVGSATQRFVIEVQ